MKLIIFLHAYDIFLYMNCFFVFLSGKNYGCYGMHFVHCCGIRLTETYKFMALATSLVVLFYCCATADIFTKLLQQCFLFFIVVVIPGH